jgi:hypothetical protein
VGFTENSVTEVLTFGLRNLPAAALAARGDAHVHELVYCSPTDA